MAYKKGYRILIFLGLLFIFSCTKYREEIEVVEVDAKNPVTGIPIRGVEFEIYQVKSWGGGLTQGAEKTESDLIHTGVTDSSGYARYEFKPMYKDGKKRVDHWIKFNYNEMDVPPGDYEILRGPPNESGTYFTGSGWGSNTDGYFYDIQIVPKLKVIEQIKNLNCYNGNDKIRYSHLFSGDWIGWIPGPNINGGYLYSCGDSVISVNPSMIQDSVFLEIEVTRNGIISTIRDSMLLDPSKTQDTIKIYF